MAAVGDKVVVVPGEGACWFARNVYKGHVGIVKHVQTREVDGRGGHLAWVVFTTLPGHSGHVNTLDLRPEEPGIIVKRIA